MSSWVRTAWGTAILLCFLLSIPLARRAEPDRGSLAKAGEGDGAGSLLVVIARRPAFALGFRNVLADLAWLKAVQVAGNRKMARSDYDRLHTLLNAIADYDRRFKVPYVLGGLILGESPAHAREALAILSRGREVYPGDWLFPFYTGYIRYFVLGSPAEGGRDMAAAARLPGSPAYLPSLASRMLSEGNDPGTALVFLAAMVRGEEDPDRREILRRRMAEVAVERDIQALERLVGEYRKRAGKLPGSLSDLAAAGLIGAIPREPHGGRYILLPDGTVRSDAVRERLRVFRQT